MGVDPRGPNFRLAGEAAVAFYVQAAAIHEEAAHFWETRGAPAKAEDERAMTDAARERAEAERKLIRS